MIIFFSFSGIKCDFSINAYKEKLKQENNKTDYILVYTYNLKFARKLNCLSII